MREPRLPAWALGLEDKQWILVLLVKGRLREEGLLEWGAQEELAKGLTYSDHFLQSSRKRRAWMASVEETQESRRCDSLVC